jgi:hypothetical protein
MRIYLIVLLLLAGCSHTLTLLPRGTGAKGTGAIDGVNQDITVELDGKRYRGKVQHQTGIAQTRGPFGIMSTTTQHTNQASALLLGDHGGRIRCDLSFDRMMTSGNGVCVDNRNVISDLMIK